MRQIIYISTILSVLLGACGGGKVDVSKVKQDLNIVRFDQLLSKVDTLKTLSDLLALQKEHEHFTNRWTFNLKGTGMILSDTAQTLAKEIRHFLTYKDYVELQNTIEKKYPNTKNIDEEILSLCKHVKYYFPKFDVRQLYYFNAALNRYSTITDDTIIGVGLDMFLGKDYPHYAHVGIPQYVSNKCEPNYIAPMMAKTIFNNMFEYNEDGKELLTLMINRGRAIYFAAQVIPDCADSLVLGLSQEKLDWCKKFEGKIFAEFSKKLMYETDPQLIMPIVSDGPSTPGLPIESPGNVGSWMGYQIVKAFMEKNPKTTLPELCSMNIDAGRFLEASAYKPR
jgi:hypothetical protein